MITDMAPMVIAVMATLLMADIIIQVAMVVTDIQTMVIMVTLHMAVAILVTVVMVIPVVLDGKIQIAPYNLLPKYSATALKAKK